MLTVTSEPAPLEAIVTAPLVAALIAPLIVTDPMVAVNDINPSAFVVMAPTVKLPVAKVKVKLRLLAVTVLTVMPDNDEAKVYAVMPMPLFVVSKPIVCVVLARAVTVSVDNIPVEAACFKYT